MRFLKISLSDLMLLSALAALTVKSRHPDGALCSGTDQVSRADFHYTSAVGLRVPSPL